MNWLPQWDRAEGKEVDLDSGEGYFTCRVKQARPNWLCFGIGLFIAAVSFAMAFLSIPDRFGFWFFVSFGTACIGLVSWAFFGSYIRRMEAGCSVSDGTLRWHEQFPLPARFDTSGVIEIASIDTLEIVDGVEGSDGAIQFTMGDRTESIGGTLGPALSGLWRKEFFEALRFWNLSLFPESPSELPAEPGGRERAAPRSPSK